MYAKGGLLPGYEKSIPTQKTGGFDSGGSGGGSGGGGSIGGGGGATGAGRFSIYDYSAKFSDKYWEVSRDDLNGKIVASENNSNTSTINKQLARDWIEKDRKRRLAEEQGSGSGSGSGSGDDGSSGGSSSDDDDDGSSFSGLTDNQRFLLIGLIVTGLFIKRVM